MIQFFGGCLEVTAKSGCYPNWDHNMLKSCYFMRCRRAPLLSVSKLTSSDFNVCLCLTLLCLLTRDLHLTIYRTNLALLKKKIVESLWPVLAFYNALLSLHCFSMA